MADTMGIHSPSAASEEAAIEELRRAREAGRRVPDFFIVGHAKCGTTALYNMLSGHPQIHMSAVKEPEYLARSPQLIEHPYAGPPRVIPQTLDAYLALFDGVDSGLRAGEASTEYLRTPASARRIAALNPEARIIAMFREPTAFLRSLHLQLLQVQVERERDFAKAMALVEERRRGLGIPRGCSWPAALLYSDHVRYALQLDAFREQFGPERVLAIVYEDFRSDNAGVTRRVLDFLDVDDGVSLESEQANPTLRVRSRQAERLVNSVAVGRGPLARGAKGVIKTLLPGPLHRALHRAALSTAIEREPTPPPPELMAELRRRYRGEVVALGERLQRDLLGLWGYEDA